MRGLTFGLKGKKSKGNPGAEAKDKEVEEETKEN